MYISHTHRLVTTIIVSSVHMKPESLYVKQTTEGALQPKHSGGIYGGRDINFYFNDLVLFLIGMYMFLGGKNVNKSKNWNLGTLIAQTRTNILIWNRTIGANHLSEPQLLTRTITLYKPLISCILIIYLIFQTCIVFDEKYNSGNCIYECRRAKYYVFQRSK